ncbi:MAG TPA: hypothetical protein VFX97_15045 [Pyrinomonadaceae bacterium]|nr:hypothetical protein [Pyrinomonadaceae bacterium]
MSEQKRLEYEQIGTIVVQVAKSFAERSADTTAEDTAALRADYQTAVEIIKLLTDIRFRCLVFVTAIIAIANALLPNNALPATRIVFGAVGFLTTLGIAVYELRNSQLYEAAMHRAKALEGRLDLIPTSDKSGPGLFSERPKYVRKAVAKTLIQGWKVRGEERDGKPTEPTEPELMTFLGVKVKHDQGLALIYGAVLGGWSFLIAHGLLSLPITTGLWPNAPRNLIGIGAAILGYLVFRNARKQLNYHDQERAPVENPSDKTENKPASESA